MSIDFGNVAMFKNGISGEKMIKPKESQPLTPIELMAKPALSWTEFWGGLLGIAESTAEEITKGSFSPEFFLIGRRRYILRENAIKWISHMAEKNPYCRRKNNKGTRSISVK